MSIGSVLVGIAVLAVVVAYVARPFRPAATVSTDRTIEAWVARVRAGELEPKFVIGTDRFPQERVEARVKPGEEGTPDQAVNYCPQCGRRVDRDDRFCSGCGTRLQRDAR